MASVGESVSTNKRKQDVSESCKKRQVKVKKEVQLYTSFVALCGVEENRR